MSSVAGGCTFIFPSGAVIAPISNSPGTTVAPLPVSLIDAYFWPNILVDVVWIRCIASKLLVLRFSLNASAFLCADL